MTTTTEVTGRYEALRAAVLAHHVNTDRRGLALLRREGMAAWATAWSSCSLAPPDRLVINHADGVFPDPTAIIALLASMALSTLQEHPS